MRILMVTPYPPVRDGIGAYAAQQVAQLLEKGERVEVLSPTPSAAHHHLDFSSWRGTFALAKRVRRYDRLVIQYHPDVFFPIGAARRLRLAITAGLTLALRLAPSVEITVHEFDSRSGRGLGLLPRLTRLMWRSADRLVVHTETERDDLHESFGVPRNRIVVEDHGRYFVARTTLDRDAARARLGIPAEGHVFLAIGFIQPHKGFDRAIKAFAGLDAVGAHLYVVGSVRTDEREHRAYAEALHEAAARTPGVVVREEYVSDEEFDVWIRAADTVLLPYRQIWSSGVLERCELLGRAAIAAKVGALDQQAHADVELFETDDELRAAMVRRATGGRSVLPAANDPFPEPPRTADGAIDREALQELIRTRAGRVRLPAPPREARREQVTRRAPARRRGLAVHRLGRYKPPAPVSARPGASFLKRIVRKATAWQIDPLAFQVNALHDAVRSDLDAMTQEIEGERGAQGAEGAA